MPSSSPIYLDYAAATPLDPNVLEAMQPYLAGAIFYNPSASYDAAIKVRQAINQARSSVAYWLGAKASEIIFTAGATEANNLAIHGVMSQFPGSKMLTSSIEHESVLSPAAEYNSQQIKINADGRLDLDDLKHKIDDQTVLVSIIYANNEIGTVQPIREISQIINKIRSTRGNNGLPIYLHSDAAQAANYLDLHVARLGVDLLTINGGKIYGPKQSGAMYLKAGVLIKPLISGGSQERNLRAGTENVAAIIGLSKALEIAQNLRAQETERLQTLQSEFISQLKQQIPEATINGSLKYRLPNNIHLTIKGQDNERLVIALDEAGIMVAAGSACSAASEEPSHVLKSLGMSDSDARASLRFSLGRGTTGTQLKQTLNCLRSLTTS